MIDKLLKWCNQPTGSKQLGIFRILFGFLMVLEIVKYNEIGFVKNFFFSSDILFHYEFLEINPLPENVMNFLLVGMLISSILIMIGLFYRVAIIYFTIVFSYFFFIDQCQYNNHLYLFCLISFLMCFLNADAAFSVRKSKWSAHIPQWQYRILQFQIGLAVFYGGVAKLNPFWFDMHPVVEMLTKKSETSGLEFLPHISIQYIIMVGGIAFDLAIPFLLLIKRTRLFAIIWAFIFNLTNSWIFDDIYLFPFFMIGSLILFIDDEEFDKLPIPRIKKPTVNSSIFNLKSISLAAVALFVLLQVALPLRYHFYPGYTDWTGDGQKFSWRMKSQYRKFDRVIFTIFDKETGIETTVLPEKHIPMHKYREFTTTPHMLVQFAEYIEGLYLKKYPGRKFGVRCDSKIQFNGSGYAPLFYPETDILEASRTHKYYHEWMAPMPRPTDK